MSNELTDVRCPCGAEFQADSYDAGFIAGSGMCQNCDAALPPKDICTCPSGDGSLRHPCPAHPAVEQVGVDERATFELFVRKHCGMPAHIAVNWDAKFTNDAWAGWQARAALAQPSPAHPAPVEQAGGDERAAFFKHLIGRHPAHETEIVRVVEHNYAAWKAWQARAALAQPSPAQAEAEQPEIVAFRYRCTNAEGEPLPGWFYSDGAGTLGLREPLMAVSQHERIVGSLRAEIAEWQEAAGRGRSDVVTYIAERAKLLEERDAALARVAELERGKVYVEARRCDECQHGGINDSATGVAACHECDWTGPEPEEDKCPGCQRENCMAAACPQCGARYVLVASEEIAAPVAQAQHSVPEGWVQSLPLKDHQPCKPNEDRANGYTIPIYSRPVLVEEALRKLRAVLCDPIGNVVIDGSDGDREEVQRALGMLAAAPGTEVPQAWLDVQAERRRQITAEGWTPEHDDLYCAAELPRAAAAYILNGANDEAPAIWPFSAKWWKPSTARRDMVKACALALAEIERLDRAASGKEVGHE
ncbi:hypothetical protein [Pseudomonas aeruginosa]|uniref:hypothetical protein n=1 Tax=Pseudomonas aeruginosa TaxID=287 RepID=UPI0029C067AC|nr:hypothetical protein [Pseudomonas aeruginosa]